eukprot:Em0004g669a
MIGTSSARFLISAVVVLAVSYSSLAQTQATTAPPEEVFCNSFAACDTCVQQKPINSSLGCYFCGSPGLSSNGSALPACKAYTVANGLAVVTLNGGCPVLDYNVGTCVLKAYVILVLIVLGIIIFLLIPMCVCCCCIGVACHRRHKRIKLRAEMKYQDEKEQIRMTSAARKADRREKNDEIRKKYGLSGDPK